MYHLCMRTILAVAHSSSRSETLNVHLPVKCSPQNIANLADTLVFPGAVYAILTVGNVYKKNFSQYVHFRMC